MGKLEIDADLLAEMGLTNEAVVTYTAARSEILASGTISLIDYNRLSLKIIKALKEELN